MKLHVVYTEDAVLLSKQSDLFWAELQVSIPGYKTSLGPWDQNEVVEYLDDEYKGLEPAASEQVYSFVQSPASFQELTFRA
jgi:DNA relaxase NicK